MKRKLLLVILGPSLFTLFAVFSMTGCLSPILTHAEGQETSSSRKASEESPGPAILGDCDVSFKGHGLCTSMDWVKYPSESETGEFILRFWQKGIGKASGPYFQPASPIFVRLWMPSMGHGSSPVEVSPFIDSNGLAVPGVYTVTHVFFVMRGGWEIQVQLKDQSKVLEQASFSLQY